MGLPLFLAFVVVDAINGSSTGVALHNEDIFQDCPHKLSRRPDR